MGNGHRKKRKKGGWILIVAILMMLSGVGVFTYPHIMQQLYEIEASRVIRDFDLRVEEYRAASEDGSLRWLYLKMVEYNEELYASNQNRLVDPWSYEQVSFSLTYFGFESEIIGYVTVPRMNIQLPIYLGASHENLRKGAAHMTQTSLPVGGPNTNSVIAAHRGMSTAAMFRDIEWLQYGDEIIITNFYQTLRYEVVETKIIHPLDVGTILIRSGNDMVTLLTCHPHRQNHQRYLVFATRIEE